MWIRILLVLVLVAAMVHTWFRASQGAIRRIEAIGWSLLWVAALIGVLRPETASALARLVGVGRGVDLALYVSIVIILFLVFHLHVLHDRLERTMTEFIRRDALRGLPEARRRFEESAALRSAAIIGVDEGS